MMNVKRKILSVVASASVIFYLGTASAAQELNQSVAPVILENSDALMEIDALVDIENIESPAIERFNIAESVEQISNPVSTEQQQGPAENNPPQDFSYTEDDLYWLSRIIEAEASGESQSGKIAVGNCVLNRVKSNEFPNTIYDVIFDTKYGVQYQPTANGMIYNTPSENSLQAAKDALSGYSVVGDAMYFCSTSVAPNSWAASNREYLTTIGNHVFYL